MVFLKGLLSSTGSASTLRFGFISIVVTVCFMCIWYTVRGGVTSLEVTLVSLILSIINAGKVVQKKIETKQDDEVKN